jgi:multidrug transporter EmrE-like cation transporter
LIKALVLVGYVFLSVGGLYGMKRADHILSWTFAGGFSLYVAGFGVWLAILRMYPLSFAFPLAAGALIVGTQVVGWWLLGLGLAGLRVVARSALTNADSDVPAPLRAGPLLVIPKLPGPKWG